MLSPGHQPESKIALPEELPPLHKMADYIAQPVQVHLRERDRAYLLKGDSQELKLTDSEWENQLLAGLGQRFVMITFYIDGVWHVCVLPSYDFQEATELFKHNKISEDRLNDMLDRAVAFFKEKGIACERRHVVTPDHSVFTGVVHRQIEALSREELKALLEGAQDKVILVSFSCRKQFEKFTFTDRAAENSHANSASKLALAVNLYEPDTIADIAKMKPPKFSLRYKLGRSTEQGFFKELCAAIVRDLYPEEKDPLKAHLKFNTDTDRVRNNWNRLRELYKTDKAAACLEIQQALTRNLYLFLFVGAQEMEMQDASGFILGIEEAEAMGIFLDPNYIPPDIAKHPLANTMREIVAEEIRNLRNQKPFQGHKHFEESSRPLIYYLVEKGYVDEVKYLLEDKVAADQSLGGTSLIELALRNKQFAVAALLYKHGARLETLDDNNQQLIKFMHNAKVDDILNLIRQNEAKFGQSPSELAKQIIKIQSPSVRKQIFDSLCDELSNDNVGESINVYDSEAHRFINFLCNTYTLPMALQALIEREASKAIDVMLKTTSRESFRHYLDQLSPQERMKMAEGYIKLTKRELSGELTPFDRAQQYLTKLSTMPLVSEQIYQNSMRLLMTPFLEEKSSQSLAIFNEAGESPLFQGWQKNPAFAAHLVRFGIIDVNFMIKKDQTVIQAFLQDNYINGIVYLAVTMKPEQLIPALDKLDPFERVTFAAIYVTHTEHPREEIAEILNNTNLNVLNRQGHTLLYEALKNWLNGTNYSYWTKVLEYLKPRADYNAGSPGFFPLDLALDGKYLSTICRFIRDGAVRFSPDRTFKLFSHLWDQYQKGDTFEAEYSLGDVKTIPVFSILEALLKPLKDSEIAEVKQNLRQAFIEYLTNINDLPTKLENIKRMQDPQNPFGKLLFGSEQELTLFNKHPLVESFQRQLLETAKHAENTLESKRGQDETPGQTS